MKVVRTVVGDIPQEQLGITATHEHLCCDERLCDCGLGGDDSTFPVPKSGKGLFRGKMILADSAMVVRELQDFRAAGGRAIVEVTVHGWGRNVSVLHRISTWAHVPVVATSGFYVERCHPAFVRERDTQELADLLVGELTVGADGTSIRTGLLKVALSRPVIEGAEKKCAEAVALAQIETGFGITTHSERRFELQGGNLGMELLDLFESYGVDPGRVIIGHTDGKADVRQLAALAERGAYVQLDMIGHLCWLLDDTRVDLVRRLVDLGYEDRLLLSSDCCNILDLKTGGGNGYDHVLRDFVPRLREAGLNSSVLDRILVKNPATALAINSDDAR